MEGSVPTDKRTGKEASVALFNHVFILIKTKTRDKLELEDDMRCSLSTIEPRISTLLRTKQVQSSHQQNVNEH